MPQAIYELISISCNQLTREKIINMTREDMETIISDAIINNIEDYVRHLPSIDLNNNQLISDTTERISNEYILSLSTEQDTEILMRELGHQMRDDQREAFEYEIETLNLMNQACRDLGKMTDKEWQKFKNRHPDLHPPLSQTMQLYLLNQKIRGQEAKISQRNEAKKANLPAKPIDRLTKAVDANIALHKELLTQKEQVSKNKIHWFPGDVTEIPNKDNEGSGADPWDKLRRLYVSKVMYDSQMKLGGIITILDRIPVEDKSALITELDEFNMSVLHYAADKEDDLRILACFVKPENLMKSITQQDMNGRTVLHHATKNPTSLNYLYSLYQDEESRQNDIKTPDANGMNVLHHAANELGSLLLTLEALPPQDRALAILQSDNNDMSVLHHAAANPRCLDMLLRLFDSNDRLTVLELADSEGKTVIDHVIENVQSVQALLSHLNPDDKKMVVHYIAEKKGWDLNAGAPSTPSHQEAVDDDGPDMPSGPKNH